MLILSSHKLITPLQPCDRAVIAVIWWWTLSLIVNYTDTISNKFRFSGICQFQLHSIKTLEITFYMAS